MDLYDVMHTTFAAREFVDEPVPDEVIYKILDNARFAPSGGNRQGWKVIVVRRAATRDALTTLIRPTLQQYKAQSAAGETPWNTIIPTRVSKAEIEATRLADEDIQRMTQAPVVLMVFVDLAQVASLDQHLDRVGLISGCSIYPFVWNILLSARNEGYGGTPTTFVAAEEKAVQKLLGVPEQMAIAAMIPIGKPVKQLTKLRRNPVNSFAVLEQWGGDALSAD